MKLDKICRICLGEKPLKPIFSTCLPTMLMACTSIQVIENDGLPNRICIQCIQSVSRAYTFKRLCEKSDSTLRQYLTSINLESISLSNEQPLLDPIKTNFFNNAESSIFSDIFGSTNTNLGDNFTSQTSTVTDLAETIQSLQTIAEQCLPDTWTNSNIINNTSANVCHFCDRIFQDEWSLNEHVKTHSEEVPTKEYANTFLENQFLIENNENANISGTEEVNKKHICHICDKGFSLNKTLVDHLRVHTGEKPFICRICGKKFARPSSLHRHREVHSAEKKHSCDVCGRTFHQVSNLNAHLRSHTGDKPHKCTICGRGCSTRRNLEMHLRTHTGEKPFDCSVCSKRFSRANQLKKHKLTHTGEKPFTCWQCGKTFRHKNTLNAHIRFHLDQRPFECTMCTKRYITSSHLKTHMKTHLVT